MIWSNASTLHLRNNLAWALCDSDMMSECNDDKGENVRPMQGFCDPVPWDWIRLAYSVWSRELDRLIPSLQTSINRRHSQSMSLRCSRKIDRNSNVNMLCCFIQLTLSR